MKYVCQICGYIYDDTKEKVPFEQLPADWKCPLCGAAKTDFKPETADGEKEKPVTVPIEAELVNLSVGQLAALCSNLARGCEKQYKTEESKLFSELADYFTAAVPAVSDATVEKLAKNLIEDAENYAGVRATADANGDRGGGENLRLGRKGYPYAFFSCKPLSERGRKNA